MNLSEIRELVHVGRPDAPYGARALARCLSISDLRRLARRRLPAAALGYLEGGGEDEWTMRRNREAFGQVELVPRVLRAVSPAGHGHDGPGHADAAAVRAVPHRRAADVPPRR